MASANLIIPPGFDEQLRKGSLESVLPQISKRIALNANKIVTQIGDFLVQTFNTSDVVKALKGQGVDLPAHFGLTDEQAVLLADGMAELIRQSVQLIVSVNNPKVIINILAASTNWDLYASLPGGEYISKPSGILIPVAKWMLIGDIDIGQAAYSIVFDGNKVDLINSRSGRALMVELDSIAGVNTPYVLPAIINKRAGENFIAYTLGQPGVAKRVIEIVLSNI